MQKINSEIKTKYTGVNMGYIPFVWNISKLKYASRIIAGYAYSAEEYTKEEGIPILRIGDIRENLNLANTKKVPSKYLELTSEMIVKKGDILVALTGATIGKSQEYKLDEIALLNQRVSVLRSNHLSSQGYLKYFIGSFIFKNFIDLECYGGAQENISTSQVGSLEIPLPPLATQKNIADYLDLKTEQIKNFIDNKKKLIALLEEQKKTIIYDVVTKGLDKNVKTKPSGAEWLGDIPEEWDVRRIKTLSKIVRGASPRPIDDQKYFDENGEFSWVRISDVTASNFYLEKTEQKLSELGASLSVKQFPDDIFLSIAGSVGKPIISKIKCCIHDGFVSFSKLSEKLDKIFLFYILYSGEAYAGLGKEGTQLNLNIDTVGNICIPMPLLSEQKRIVKKIEENLLKIDQVIATVQQEIELIEEYKKSIIYHAVTGKIEKLLTNE